MKTILLTATAVLIINGCMNASDVKPSHAPAMTTHQLCEDMYERDVLYKAKSPNIINELKRRKAFNAHEWNLINTKTIQVGMSKDTLLCVSGKPERVNRSSYGDAQYVFLNKGYSGSKYYVYINESKNIVTAWNQ